MEFFGTAALTVGIAYLIVAVAVWIIFNQAFSNWFRNMFEDPGEWAFKIVGTIVQEVVAAVAGLLWPGTLLALKKFG